MSIVTEKIRVMYVDDEENNLISFKAAFRNTFDVFTANSAADAIEKLDNMQEKVHVILSDYRMPKTNGVEFFQMTKYMYPEIERILVTAYSDIDTIINAVNKVHIFKFINKPWKESEVIHAIQQAYQISYARKALEQQRHELALAYKEMDTFIYTISHDLKSPLMGISAIVRLMEQEKDTTEIINLSRYISRNAEKLEAFVNNMLHYHRIKRGNMEITDVNFKELVDEVTGIYEAIILTQKINLLIDIKQTDEFYSDRMLISSIIQNLISNAIKYQNAKNPSKEIKIKIVVEDLHTDIEISDNGIGIEKQYLNRIFDMFFRATSQSKGSGIGLYNVNNAISKLGGNINVRSSFGEGTNFIMRLPNKNLG